MIILLLLIPLSLMLLGVAVWAFFWAVRRGQFEDMDTPALDILREDPNERWAAFAVDPSTPSSTSPNTSAEPPAHAD